MNILNLNLGAFITYQFRFTSMLISYTYNSSSWNLLPELEEQVIHLLNNQQPVFEVVKAIIAMAITACCFKNGNDEKVLEWAKTYYFAGYGQPPPLTDD